MSLIAKWLVAGLAVASATLIARPAAAEPFDTAQVLDDAALRGERGGFTWQGMQISLGANLRTFIDGQLALHSTISWNAAGASTTETVHDALTPAGADQLRAGVLTSGQITMNVADARVFLANAGQTALIQRTDGGIHNILVNTASDVALRQEVEVTLGLAGYAGFAQSNAFARLGGAIGDAVSQATLGALGR